MAALVISRKVLVRSIRVQNRAGSRAPSERSSISENFSTAALVAKDENAFMDIVSRNAQVPKANTETALLGCLMEKSCLIFQRPFQ